MFGGGVVERDGSTNFMMCNAMADETNVLDRRAASFLGIGTIGLVIIACLLELGSEAQHPWQKTSVVLDRLSVCQDPIALKAVG